MKEESPQGCNAPLNNIFYFQCLFRTIILEGAGDEIKCWANILKSLLESLVYKISLGYSIKPKIIIYIKA